MRGIGAGFVCLAAGSALGQITLGQIDNFQDGTVMGWIGAAPTNIANGGPLGAGDRYLQITSTGGSGPGSNLATYNQIRWSGNFSAAGVTSIEADLRNTGNTDLVMRLVLFGANFDRWTSTAGVSLPAGGGWTHVSFSLAPGAMTQVLGSSSYSATLTAVERMMFRHDPAPPSATGSPIAGQLGIDNIRAVPEPASLSALGAGLLLLLKRRRR
jgi:hypothetical protein